MSATGNRHIQTHLVQDSGANVYTDSLNPSLAAKIGNATALCLWFFPRALYPLTECNQIILRWNLATLPTGATFVDIYPFSFETFSNVTQPSNDGISLIRPAYFDGAGAVHEMLGLFQFDQFDNTNSLVTPHTYKIHKTAVDSPITLSGISYAVFTRHAIPISEEYVGFYITTDGTDNTGSMNVFVELGRS